jgi:ATP-dependent RNA helicase RhlE
MENNSTVVDSFGNLGIAPKLLEILSKHKFEKPTPIQSRSIPPAIQGKDLMGIAQTGTGKTLAFGIPMIQRLAQSQGNLKGLVILPTRELALQVDATLRKIGSTLGLKTAILIGGESMEKQFRMLKQNPHIIIATPGRLTDHIQNKRLDLSKCGVLVLDEADRMLDMGFAPQIRKIMEHVPKERQTMLFSATMPDEIVRIAQSYLTLPLRIEVAPAGTSVHTVTQELFFVDRTKKLELLRSLLTEYKGSVLVFSRTKHGARKIAQSVRAMGHTASEIHSNRSLNQRIEALEGFKIGRYRVLIATDIAARGIDVTGIQLVINFDLPATAEDYVHRIGRTGRAGMTGHAISFALPDQRGDVRSIERLIRKTLDVSRTPELKSAPPVPQATFSQPSPARAYSKPYQRNSQRPYQKSTERNSRPARKHGRYQESKTRRNDIPNVRRPIGESGPGYFMERRGHGDL